MKKIFMVRHSKAEQDAESDFRRNLDTEGKLRAGNVAAKMKQFYSPDSLFITSPANRALQTAQIFSRIFNISESNIICEKFLYGYFNTESFFDFCNTFNHSNELWIFGHNPSFSMIAGELSQSLIDSLPKCAVATFSTTHSEWLVSAIDDIKLEFYHNPKK